MNKLFFTVWLVSSINLADHLNGALRSVREITQWRIVCEPEKN